MRILNSGVSAGYRGGWLLGGMVLPAQLPAQIIPSNEYALLNQVTAPAGFVSTVAPQELFSVQAEVSPATLQDVAAFKLAAGPNWKFYVDRRSGAMALVE